MNLIVQAANVMDRPLSANNVESFDEIENTTRLKTDRKCENCSNLPKVETNRDIRHINNKSGEDDERTRVLALSKILLAFLKRTDRVKFHQCRVELIRCHERHNTRKQGSESFAVAVEKTLRDVLGDEYWSIADYQFKRLQIDKSYNGP